MIIVTGGAGFIGSNLVKALNDLGIEDIIVVDDLEQSEKHLNLGKLKFIDYIDYLDFIENLEDYCKECTTIFHQGACSDTTERNGHYMMNVNYTYSKQLLNFAIGKEINFLYASSAAVYGNGKNGFTEEPACENPLNIYAFSKLTFDNYVRHKLKTEKPKSQVVGLRYFNVYGPREQHKGRMSSVVNHFYQQSENENQINIFKGSRKFLRDFIFVEDVAAVNLFFYKSKKSGIFNCGTGSPRSFYDIAEIVQREQNNPKIKEISFPEDLKGKYQEYTKADLAKLRNIGYQSEFHNLESGVKKYLAHLKK